MPKNPDVIDKINAAVRAGRELTLTIPEMLELGNEFNFRADMAAESAAMLNIFVAKTQGQVSHELH